MSNYSSFNVELLTKDSYFDFGNESVKLFSFLGTFIVFNSYDLILSTGYSIFNYFDFFMSKADFSSF